MPRGDQRGPEGAGPMTGRAFGYCAGNDQPGFAVNAAPQGAGRGFRSGAGRGMRYGRGFGRCRGMGYGRSFFGNRGRGAYYAPAAADEEEYYSNQGNQERELTRLENLANTLAGELENVKKEIDKLKND